jgi:hypothetical protein
MAGTKPLILYITLQEERELTVTSIQAIKKLFGDDKIKVGNFRYSSQIEVTTSVLIPDTFTHMKNLAYHFDCLDVALRQEVLITIDRPAFERLMVELTNVEALIKEAKQTTLYLLESSGVPVKSLDY